MKNYISPIMVVKSLMNKNDISSLNDWLNSAEGGEYKEAGVVTYVMLSE